MTTTLYGIRNCDTVKKARAFLDAGGIPYDFHDFKSAGATRAQIERWCDAKGWETVLNRAGTTFRKLPDEEKQGLDRDRAVELMLAQPSMIKRPVVEAGEAILVGFSREAYEKAFG